MKKIFFSLLFLLLFFSANASDDVSGKTISVGISFPFIANDYKIDDFDLEKISAVGINLSARRIKEDMKFGIFLNADIFMPYTRTIIWDEKYQTTTNRSNYDLFFGTDILAGLYTSVFHDSTINFPVGAGLHLDGFLSKQKTKNIITKESVYTVGLGAWANFEVTVSKKLGVYAGSKFAYDFYHKSNRSRTSSVSVTREGKCKGFTIVPTVGVLWHFAD